MEEVKSKRGRPRGIGQKYITFGVRVTEDVYNKISELSLKEQRSKNKIVQMFIDACLEVK